MVILQDINIKGVTSLLVREEMLKLLKIKKLKQVEKIREIEKSMAELYDIEQKLKKQLYEVEVLGEKLIHEVANELDILEKNEVEFETLISDNNIKIIS